MGKDSKKEKVYVAIARILARGPWLNIKNKWYLRFNSLEEAALALCTLSLKQPVDIYRRKWKVVTTPSRNYRVTYFYARPRLNPTDLKVKGEIIEWVPYRDVKSEVNSLVDELFRSEIKNPEVLNDAISKKTVMFDIVKVRYKDRYERFGEVWVLRRFYRETLERHELIRKGS